MRNIFYIFIVNLFFIRHSIAIDANKVSLSQEINKNNLQTHVKFLSSDELEGRLTGSRGEKLATQYIAEYFQKLGLEPAGDNGTFFQAFQFSANQKIRYGRNVLAKLKMGKRSAPIIVVGAHVDHLGRAKLNRSLARLDEVGMIHPGADDNASGVATVLEIASYLSHLKAQGRLNGNKGILFAAWSGEELGILGSSHFVKEFMKNNTNKLLRPDIDAVINLDMVGHLRKKLVLQGVGSSADWPKLISGVKTLHPLSIVMQDDPYLPTDTTSFYLHGVPILNFFSGAHDSYHTPRDTALTLNYDGMAKIANLLLELILALENKPNIMSYQEVKKSKDPAERKLKIYLGTIPDYTSADASGVKLAGVIKHSPAEIAGLKPEDVIVELAGKNIHDIYDYTFVLNGLHVGVPAKLVVLREQKKLALAIVARYRD